MGIELDVAGKRRSAPAREHIVVLKTQVLEADAVSAMFWKFFRGDQRKGRPVKVDLAQPRLLGRQSYRSFFGLVADKLAVRGVDLACSGIHGDDLKEIAGFDNASP